MNNRIEDLSGNVLAYAIVRENNDCYVCAVSKTEDVLNLTFD